MLIAPFSLLMMLQTAASAGSANPKTITVLPAGTGLPRFQTPDGKTIEVVMVIVKGSGPALKKARERLANQHWETKMDCWASERIPMPGLCIAFGNVAPDRARDLLSQLKAGAYGQLEVQPIASEVVSK